MLLNVFIFKVLNLDCSFIYLFIEQFGKLSRLCIQSLNLLSNVRNILSLLKEILWQIQQPLHLNVTFIFIYGHDLTLFVLSPGGKETEWIE